MNRNFDPIDIVFIVLILSYFAILLAIGLTYFLSKKGFSFKKLFSKKTKKKQLHMPNKKKNLEPVIAFEKPISNDTPIELNKRVEKSTIKDKKENISQKPKNKKNNYQKKNNQNNKGSNNKNKKNNYYYNQNNRYRSNSSTKKKAQPRKKKKKTNGVNKKRKK